MGPCEVGEKEEEDNFLLPKRVIESLPMPGICGPRENKK
jgi:hypothetical protein